MIGAFATLRAVVQRPRARHRAQGRCRSCTPHDRRRTRNPLKPQALPLSTVGANVRLKRANRPSSAPTGHNVAHHFRSTASSSTMSAGNTMTSITSSLNATSRMSANTVANTSPIGHTRQNTGNPNTSVVANVTPRTPRAGAPFPPNLDRPRFAGTRPFLRSAAKASRSCRLKTSSRAHGTGADPRAERAPEQHGRQCGQRDCHQGQRQHDAPPLSSSPTRRGGTPPAMPPTPQAEATPAPCSALCRCRRPPPPQTRLPHASRAYACGEAEAMRNAPRKAHRASRQILRIPHRTLRVLQWTLPSFPPKTSRVPYRTPQILRQTP